MLKLLIVNSSHRLLLSGVTAFPNATRVSSEQHFYWGLKLQGGDVLEVFSSCLQREVKNIFANFPLFSS